jgi:hypothetical protein
LSMKPLGIQTKMGPELVKDVKLPPELHLHACSPAACHVNHDSDLLVLECQKTHVRLCAVVELPFEVGIHAPYSTHR